MRAFIIVTSVMISLVLYSWLKTLFGYIEPEELEDETDETYQ